MFKATRYFLTLSLSILFLCNYFASPSFAWFFDVANNASSRQTQNYEENQTIYVYEKVNPSIVAIEADVPNGISSGSGCVINSSGVILTSSHVIDGAKKIIVITSQGE